MLTPVMSVIDDCFDFIFFSVLDQVRWRAFEVGAVSGGFFVGQ